MSKNIVNFTEPHMLANMPSDTPVLVGLSGGADSTALLHIMCRLREKLGFELYAAHLNHGIRTEQYQNEADRDEEFCKQLCSSLGVTLFVEHLDLPSLSAKSGRSIETEARAARYSFFTRVMNENGISILATAHNADDNFETQLINICRGCGTDGLCGIPKVRELKGVKNGIVVRPILSLSKNEILEYCRNSGLSYVTDSTNFEDDCTRNIIRHRVIPELVKLFPAALNASERLSEHALEDSDYLKQTAEKLILEWNGSIKPEAINALHPAVKKRIFMLAFSKASAESLESVHISSLSQLCKTAKEGSSSSLPNRMRAVICRGELVFEKDVRGSLIEKPRYDIKLGSGINEIPNTAFAVLIESVDTEKTEYICLKNNEYALYAQATLRGIDTSDLYARSRQGGESIRDGDMSKKIKKLMCDKKVSVTDRDSLPLIYSGGELVYVPLCAVSDRAKSQSVTGLQISIYKLHTEKKK